MSLNQVAAVLGAAIREGIDARLAELGITGTNFTQPVVAGGPMQTTPVPMMQPAVIDQASTPSWAFCFKCSKPGNERANTQTGAKFWVCPDKSCGYTTPAGKFVQSLWDAGNWQERYERNQKFANR